MADTPVDLAEIATDADSGRIGEYAAMLQKVPLLRSLTDEERRKIAGQVKVSEFEDGDPIIKQGDAGDAMYIIQSGGAQAFVEGVPGCVMDYGASSKILAPHCFWSARASPGVPVPSFCPPGRRIRRMCADLPSSNTQCCC